MWRIRRGGDTILPGPPRRLRRSGPAAEAQSVRRCRRPRRLVRRKPEEMMSRCPTTEAADHLAREYFLSHWRGPQAQRYHPVRLAELTDRGLVYYQVRPIAPQELPDDDRLFLGSGGFFVALETGEVRDVG